MLFIGGRAATQTLAFPMPRPEGLILAVELPTTRQLQVGLFSRASLTAPCDACPRDPAPPWVTARVPGDPGLPSSDSRVPGDPGPRPCRGAHPGRPRS